MTREHDNWNIGDMLIHPETGTLALFMGKVEDTENIIMVYWMNSHYKGQPLARWWKRIGETNE